MVKNIIPILLLCYSMLLAQDAPEKKPEPTPREKNKATADKLHSEQLLKYGKNKDYLVLPGLLADRINKRITIQGEATGITEGSTVEFSLIGEKSGHDYEALALSFARPSDVHKALEFIGMTAGRPVDYKKLNFWPKGERVFMTIAGVRCEQMMRGGSTNKPASNGGLVFTGAVMEESRIQPGSMVYSADVQGPYSIAANYNERKSVLDVPRQAMQGSVYGSQVVGDGHIMKKHKPLTIVLEPEYKDGKKRVMDLKLQVLKGQKGTGEVLADLEFKLTDSEGKVLNKKSGLNGMLSAIVSITESGRDPYVALDFDDNVSIKALNELCGILVSIETESGIRVEPPSADDLYFKAFIPKEAHRKREKRIGQPWELHLKRQESSVNAVLVQIKETWKRGEIWPDLTVTEHPVESPQGLREKLDEIGPGKNAILIYVEPDLKLGQLMKYVKPVFKTHPNIHIFVQK